MSTLTPLPAGPQVQRVVPVLGLVVLAAVASAAEPAAALSSSAWKLERVELSDGRSLEGILDDEVDGDSIAFTEVVRRPGRGMYLVARPSLGRDRVRSIERLPPKERDELAARIREFRDRGSERIRAEAAVRLSRDADTGRLRYDGESFSLESSAADPLTRETIVRLEQLFAAFEMLLPVEGVKTLAVRICGSDAEYRGVQRSLGIAVENPAIFVPAKRLLVTGGDVPMLVEEHGRASESLAAADIAIAEQDRGIEPLLRELTKRLEHQGIPAAQRAEIVRRARARHERERSEDASRIASARRGNIQRLDLVRKRFHERLAHEAWHAHAHRLAESVERNVSLPVWLDEGLAQVFETAVLEVGDLRLDAAEAARLEPLRLLLASSSGPLLAEVLRSGGDSFLVGHHAKREASERAYLVAWGLAVHVAVLEPVLDRAALRRMVQPAAASDPVRQFEALVGMPLDRFEPAWKARMLTLPRASR